MPLLIEFKSPFSFCVKKSIILTILVKTPTPLLKLLPVKDPIAAEKMNALIRNSKDFGIQLYPCGTEDQGIIHVIAPEKGFVQPGMVIVCGDSHTSTHGAFGALAFGIGISEVAHVLATQTLHQKKPKKMAVTLKGKMPETTTAKDLILFILQNIGTDGGVGHVIEYRGEAIKALSMEGRMTICNMSIEGGARAGMIAPDEITFEYLKDKPYAPKGEEWEKAVQEWNKLYTDEGAVFDKEVVLDVTNLTPYVTWGTAPAQAISIDSEVPMPKNPNEEKALEYMGLKPGTPMKEINIDAVFIGSCTNSRIEDLRAAAEIVKGHKVKDGVKVMVVPGSMKVKDQKCIGGTSFNFKNSGRIRYWIKNNGVE
ncbi:aconitase family protein [Calidifontibacillus erzurumensis]|uniref:aconitase family protein n=1 Tax=Calidifontibacillus erzurumensis TaxID=2741433 RepID=UPI0035B536AF